MYQDLGVTLNPLVKLLIRRRCIIDMDIMRDHEARLSLPSDDQVPKVPVILLDVALARPKSEPLSTKVSIAIHLASQETLIPFQTTSQNSSSSSPAYSSHPAPPDHLAHTAPAPLRPPSPSSPQYTAQSQYSAPP